MVRDGGDITALVTARLPEVAGVLDLLDDGGGHLAHTVGHRHPAGRADLQRQLSSVTSLTSHLSVIFTIQHCSNQRLTLPTILIADSQDSLKTSPQGTKWALWVHLKL